VPGDQSASASSSQPATGGQRKRCLCDGRYDGCAHDRGSCDQPPGTPWSEYFCSACDERRRAHISNQLEEILAAFNA